MSACLANTYVYEQRKLDAIPMLLLRLSFCPKIASEAILGHLNSKTFPGEHGPYYAGNMSKEHQAYNDSKVSIIFHAFSERWYDSRLPLHCCRWLTRRTTGELLRPANSNLFTHIFMHVLSTQWRKALTQVFCIHLLVLHRQMECIAANTLVWTAGWFSMAARLVDKQ